MQLRILECAVLQNVTHGWHICDVWRNLYNPVIIFYNKMFSCLAERQSRLDKLHVISNLTFLDKASWVLLLVSLKHPSKLIILPSLATNHSHLCFKVNCCSVWYLFCNITKVREKKNRYSEPCNKFPYMINNSPKSQDFFFVQILLQMFILHINFLNSVLIGQYKTF